jgi:KaiC/GvpD/RAD55 family RecA-like ATPase
MDRVKTGIKGFDELVQGGFPKNFNILLTGLPGTGKTIFGMQYLYNGAMNGEPGIYVSLDMADQIFRDQGRQFGWDIERLEAENKLSIIKVPLDRERIRIFEKIKEEAKRIGAKRLVFDSLATFAINIDQFEVPLEIGEEVGKILGKSTAFSDGIYYAGSSYKRVTYLAINQLSKIGTTNILITDEQMGGSHTTIDGVSEYVSDGVVQLELADVGGGPARMLKVSKIRGTSNSLEFHSFDITSKGIVVSQPGNK